MNKQQFDLLDKFGVGQWEPHTMQDLKDLQVAVRAAVNILPFAKIEGMEHEAA